MARVGGGSLRTERTRAQSRRLWSAPAAVSAVVFAAAACSLLGEGTPPSEAGDIVTTASGTIRGSIEDGYREFLGIPYAAPPVGELRWGAPRPPAPWERVRDATEPATRCLQQATLSGDEVDQSEDCLYLNLTTTDSATPQDPKPVMVWIHGGGFVEGSGDEYDPSRLAVQGEVVVVTLNYRLGIFGNFGHPELEGSGSYGLQDQQAALRWVRDNVARFGGDPENVTVFGQSAGGQSVCAHLTSPKARGLFHHAIIQSAFCTWDLPANLLAPGIPAVSPWEAVDALAERGTQTAADLGCGEDAPIDCLRGLPAADLMRAFGEFAGPSYGTPVLPENPYQVIRDGRAHPVPVLSGTTRDENTLTQALLDLAGEPLTPEQYNDNLSQAFSDHADDVAERYPLDDFESPSHAWAIVTTDRGFTCPTLERNRLLAEQAPVFAYEFADQAAPPILPDVAYPYGAYHSADALYLFDMRHPADQAQLDAKQQDLAAAMIAYWTNFAGTGDPNGHALPHWPRIDSDKLAGEVQTLAPGIGGIAPTDVYQAHQCAFWAKITPTANGANN